MTPNTIYISHKHHKHDKAYYSCSSKCYPQNELLKFTVCLLVFKIMPQYLRQSNMKLNTSDMFPLVKCLQYEMSDVALILVPVVHTSRWFSKYSINREQPVFIYDNHPYQNFSVAKCIKDTAARTSFFTQVLDCRASTEQFSAVSECDANTFTSNFHIIKQQSLPNW